MNKRKSPARAVALYYDNTSPPRVVASGEGAQAELIRAAGLRLGTPLIDDPALAEALLALELDASIPEELFVSVAVVLSWAYWLQGKRPAAAKDPA